MKILWLAAVVWCVLAPPVQASKERGGEWGTATDVVTSLRCHMRLRQGQQSWEDIRCKCICPPRNISGHIYNKNVSQKDCNCLHVVEPMSVPGNDVEAYCLLCECKYEERSTTTIKRGGLAGAPGVVVPGTSQLWRQLCSVIVPLQPSPLTARFLPSEASSLGAATPPAGARANTVLERVEGAQQRWELQVQEQRKTVFDRHKMLS
uniref:Transmembrane protein 9 n=1 Tax=Pelodiscus sinensis TaxID=13735 RepID=K7F9J9_PELSI